MSEDKSTNTCGQTLMKKVSLRNDIIAVYALSAICLLAGSLYDFPISKDLFRGENVFGILLCAYGESPAELVYTAIGAMLFSVRCKTQKVWNVIRLIAGVLFAAYGLEELYSVPTRFLADLSITGMDLPVILADIVLSASVFVLFSKAAAKADWRTVVFISGAMLLTVLVSSEINSLLKTIWSRPRMRLISANESVAFQPWWQIGSPEKETVISSGVSKGEFASFPSGHATGAAGVFMVTWLHWLDNKYSTGQRALYWAGIIFAALVSLSRIMMGAHFLSDVTVGFLIGFTVYVLTGMLLACFFQTVPGDNKVLSRVCSEGPERAKSRKRPKVSRKAEEKL